MRITPALLSLCGLSLLLSACASSPQQSDRIARLDHQAMPAGSSETAAAVEHEAEQVADARSLSVAVPDESPAIQPAEAINQTTDDLFPAVQTDLWQRLRNNYSMPQIEHRRINSEVDWYARHPKYLDRVAERAEPYLYFIVEEIERRNMPAEIALLPIVESAFKPFAYSHGRAAGIWQFIPGTGRRYGLKQNWWYDGRRDVYAATHAALDYLQALNKEFNGDWMLALAAYNAGSGNVRKAIRQNKKKGKPTDFFSLNLPKETRGYVPRLIAISRIIANPEQYGLTLRPISNTPRLAQVDVGSQLDLALAADMAGLSLQELYKLNPGMNRWSTPPKGPHKLLLPVDAEQGFMEKLAQLPDDQRIRWKHHRVKRGQTLSHIADKHRITVAELKRVNKLKGSFLRVGQDLVIPAASKSAPTYALSAEQRKKKILNAPKSGRHKILHTVRAGDTFWDIARRYGVGVRQLAKWNAMAPRDTLQRGKQLVIWSRTPNATASSTPAASPVSLAKSGNGVVQKVNYVVRRGDSLARIAARFRVSVKDLLRWNKRLNIKNYLQPGQRVKLFVDITRQAG
ncbi:MAG: LysM peptidoglycan-binding domain-containing protein [Granulosicoccaceae bacterium]|jgi:membrane-bound lytic murein transglycosylase D